MHFYDSKPLINLKIKLSVFVNIISLFFVHELQWYNLEPLKIMYQLRLNILG